MTSCEWSWGEAARAIAIEPELDAERGDGGRDEISEATSVLRSLRTTGEPRESQALLRSGVPPSPRTDESLVRPDGNQRVSAVSSPSCGARFPFGTYRSTCSGQRPSGTASKASTITHRPEGTAVGW